MVGGSFYYQGDRDQRKSWEVGKAEIKAKEKNALWIKELEARDLEEKEVRFFSGGVKGHLLRYDMLISRV